jgi:hypothetical protein
LQSFLFIYVNPKANFRASVIHGVFVEDNSTIMEDQYKNWDETFDSGKATELLPQLKEAEKTDGSNPELLWRISRCIFEIGTGQDTNEEKVFPRSEILLPANVLEGEIRRSTGLCEQDD